MSSTDTLVQRQIENEDRQIRRALEGGGLPTEDEANAVSVTLRDAIEQLNELTGRIEGIALSDDGEELPFEVSLEHLGVIALLTTDVASEIGVLTELNERARSRIYSLITTHRAAVQAWQRCLALSAARSSNAASGGPHVGTTRTTATASRVASRRRRSPVAGSTTK